MTGVDTTWPARIAYRLDPAEIRRSSAFVTGRSARGTFVQDMLLPLYALNGARLLWHYDNIFMRIGIVACVALSTAPVILHVMKPESRASSGIVREADLAVGQSGLSGRLDGAERCIAWQAIASVADTGSEFVINRKGLVKPIVIPKRVMPDPAALWALFDRHLTGTRGLIRPAHRTTLWNTRSPQRGERSPAKART